MPWTLVCRRQGTDSALISVTFGIIRLKTTNASCGSLLEEAARPAGIHSAQRRHVSSSAAPRDVAILELCKTAVMGFHRSAKVRILGDI